MKIKRLKVGQIWEVIDLKNREENLYWKVKIIHKTVIKGENRWIALKIKTNEEELIWACFMVFNDFGRCIPIEDLDMDFYLSCASKSHSKEDRI